MYLLEKRYLVTKALNKALLDRGGDGDGGGGGDSTTSSSNNNDNNNYYKNYDRQPEDLEPFSTEDARNWLQWLADRERFRQIGVRGGKNGELGQGWRSEKVFVDGRDFYREEQEWMSERYGPGMMLGWEEIYHFDEYLGEMGDWDLKGGPRGLQKALLGAAQLRETEKGEMVVLDFDDVVD